MANITQRGKSYFLTVSCGYDSHGKQIRKTKTWTPDDKMTNKQIEKELQRQAVIFEEQIKSGTYVDDRVPFSDFIDELTETMCFHQMMGLRSDPILFRLGFINSHQRTGLTI